MSKKSNTLPIGYRLHHYRIEAVLGAGGFGITYRALHEALRSQVAIKEYFPVEWSYRDRDDVNVLANTQGDLPASEQGEDACYAWGLERFLNEARILAQVDHPSVVRVRDFFQANGTAYIVMDYEAGEPLSQLLQREKTLAEERIHRLLDDVLPALEAVHGLGYLHRDIKPANLYCRSDGRTILIDFGAARQALGQRSKNVTSVFTIGYSPIEQYLADGKSYGPWTDIYALGAVLYQCVTGRPPVEAPARVLDDPLRPAVEAAKGRYSWPLLHAIDQAIAIRPESRFQSIAKLRVALEPRSGDEQTVELELPLRPEPRHEADQCQPITIAKAPQPASELTDRQEKPRRWPDWRWLLGLLALLAIGAGIAKAPSCTPQPLSPAIITPTPPVVTPVAPRSQIPANPQPGQSYVDSLSGIEFVWVGPGCFAMGSTETERDRSTNEPSHPVCPTGFWLGKYEITNSQYGRFDATHDSGRYDSTALNGDDQPVVRVNWHQAFAYAAWLSEKTGARFRLPTEAEWEYAARSGKTVSRPWLDDPKQACRYANIYDETARQAKPFNWANYPCEDGQAVVTTGGKYPANGFGLYDMLGNVAEWTCSEYDGAYTGGETRCAVSDSAGGRRVLRGGSWSDYPGLVRFAYRFPAAPEYRKFDLGFRLVLEP